jgi:hypothetical protein
MATPRLTIATPWLSESGSRPLSPTATPRLAELKSRQLPDSPCRRVCDSPTRRVGESFFDYEYLREFEAQIGTARNVV